MRSDGTDLLAVLLAPRDAAARERAWERFVSEHSRLILHAIRHTTSSHDEVMDRYAFVLEQLRADEFRRLRGWGGDRGAKLTTWLVVVVRRLCTDYVRRRYGRSRGADATAAERSRRRRLADFVAEELKHDVAETHALESPSAEDTLRADELRTALARAVAALPADERLLLTLRFRDGLSAAQIARLLAVPSPFHVYRRLNQLLGRLRRVLEQDGVEDPVP